MNQLLSLVLGPEFMAAEAFQVSFPKVPLPMYPSASLICLQLQQARTVFSSFLGIL
jgi:hypothetical protein